MNAETEYPPNHTKTESDGSLTLVRYWFERELTRGEMMHEEMGARRNILAMLRDEPLSSDGLRDVTLYSRHAIASVCGRLANLHYIVHRDGKWRVAS